MGDFAWIIALLKDKFQLCHDEDSLFREFSGLYKGKTWDLNLSVLSEDTLCDEHFLLQISNTTANAHRFIYCLSLTKARPDL